jgi:glycosyltransferase involved in cell wall biosynthesis
MIIKNIIKLSLIMFLSNYNCINSIYYNSFVIIVASYNNANYCKKNLDSILLQNYPKSMFRVIYTDDCSTDDTLNLVKNYIYKYSKTVDFKLINNTKRLGSPLANHYKMLSLCKDSEIAVLVDGDDWLIDNNVLTYLNNVYQDQNIDLTYGQYLIHDNHSTRKGVCKLIPQDVINKKEYRTHFSGTHFYASHLKTFKIKLFNKIYIDKLRNNNVFFKHAGDVALMCALLEESDGRFKFIDKILYGYNCFNPINEFKIYDTYKAALKAYSAQSS